MHTFQIDLERNILFAEFNGSLDLRQLASHMDDVLQNEAFKEGINTMADLRNAFIDMAFNELSVIRDLLQFHERKRKSEKWAVLIKSATTRAIINLALPLIGLKRTKIKTFNHKESALAWLMDMDEHIHPDTYRGG